MAWQQALDYCESKNKKLVSIMSKKEHDQLANAMHTCGAECLGESLYLDISLYFDISLRRPVVYHT